MGRLLNTITGTKSVLVLGQRQKGKVVVTGRPTNPLRTFFAAQSNLARLALRLGAELLAMRHRFAKPVTLGAPCATGRSWSRAWRMGLGPSRPGYSHGGRS